MEQDLDPLGAQAFLHGHPLDALDRLREDTPIFPTLLADGTRAWNLVRYDDVLNVLSSWPRYAVQPHVAHVEPGTDAEGNQAPWRLKAMMTLNPPEHGPHRQRLSPNMRRNRIEAFRPVVRAVANSIVRDLRETGDFDAIEDFAAPAAAAITCEYLRVKPANRGFVRRLSAAFMGDSLPPVEVGAYSRLELGPRALNAIQGSPMRAATELMHESWGHAPWLDENFVGNAEHWEVEDLALQHLTAGVAGLRNCIATAVVCLEQNWHAARHHGAPWIEHLPGVADEVLRHATPLLRGKRIVMEDATWYGTNVRKGDTIFAWLVGANFDPRKFEAPRAFQPLRAPNPHLSFSGGAHLCLGAPLVKMEIEEVLRAILTNWTSMRLRAKPVRFASNVVNEFLHLPIRVS